MPCWGTRRPGVSPVSGCVGAWLRLWMRVAAAGRRVATAMVAAWLLALSFAPYPGRAAENEYERMFVSARLPGGSQACRDQAAEVFADALARLLDIPTMAVPMFSPISERDPRHLLIDLAVSLDEASKTGAIALQTDISILPPRRHPLPPLPFAAESLCDGDKISHPLADALPVLATSFAQLDLRIHPPSFAFPAVIYDEPEWGVEVAYDGHSPAVVDAICEAMPGRMSEFRRLSASQFVGCRSEKLPKAPHLTLFLDLVDVGEDIVIIQAEMVNRRLGPDLAFCRYPLIKERAAMRQMGGIILSCAYRK